MICAAVDGVFVTATSAIVLQDTKGSYGPIFMCESEKDDFKNHIFVAGNLATLHTCNTNCSSLTTKNCLFYSTFYISIFKFFGQNTCALVTGMINSLLSLYGGIQISSLENSIPGLASDLTVYGFLE